MLIDGLSSGWRNGNNITAKSAVATIIRLCAIFVEQLAKTNRRSLSSLFWTMNLNAVGLQQCLLPIVGTNGPSLCLLEQHWSSSWIPLLLCNFYSNYFRYLIHLPQKLLSSPCQKPFCSQIGLFLSLLCSSLAIPLFSFLFPLSDSFLLIPFFPIRTSSEFLPPPLSLYTKQSSLVKKNINRAN